MEKIKKQALKEVAHRIDAYCIEKKITSPKLSVTQSLPKGDMSIPRTNKK